jgi:hypothetical protein
MRIRILWTSLYALLLLCFFFIGIYYRSFTWAGFFVLPFAMSIFYGYFRKLTGDVFRTATVGLVLYALSTAVLLGILTTFEAFWVYLENWGELMGWQEVTAFNDAVGAAAILYIGVVTLQILLGFSGILVGIGIEKFAGLLRPSKERIITYGDFSKEGISRSGVVKVRVVGTVPQELYEWMKQEIDGGNYFNQSHIMEVALTKLKEKESQQV